MLAYILDPSLKSCEIFSKLFPLSQPQWHVYKTENSTYLRGLWGRAVIQPHGAHSPVAAHSKCPLLLLQLLMLLLWYQIITESQPSIRERWRHHFFAGQRGRSGSCGSLPALGSTHSPHSGPRALPDFPAVKKLHASLLRN